MTNFALSIRTLDDLDATADHRIDTTTDQTWANGWWRLFKHRFRTTPPLSHAKLPDWVWDLYVGDLPWTPDRGTPVKAAIMAMPDFEEVSGEWREITGEPIFEKGEE